MARVTRLHKGVQHVKNVKNLGWFFRKARTTVIDRFEMIESNDGWEMFADFADGHVFATHYNSLDVFKQVMKRQRSLKGYTVRVVRSSGPVEQVRL